LSAACWRREALCFRRDALRFPALLGLDLPPRSSFQLGVVRPGGVGVGKGLPTYGDTMLAVGCLAAEPPGGSKNGLDEIFRDAL
jgi:hypothetical protein